MEMDEGSMKEDQGVTPTGEPTAPSVQRLPETLLSGNRDGGSSLADTLLLPSLDNRVQPFVEPLPDTGSPTISFIQGEEEPGETLSGSPVAFPQADEEFPELPHIRYTGFLAEGGMGRVFRAFHLGLSMPVVVKVLKPEVTSSFVMERFIEEARLAARIRHANVVRVMDSGISNGRHFIVMEYVEGESAAALVRREGPLPWQRAAHIIRCVARGLEVLHQAQIFHCDVKPSNILLGVDGSIVLADFGLARRRMDIDEAAQPGTIFGTPHYMAPEQVRDPGFADAATDVYSLGATLFHLLAGDPPYQGSVLEIARSLLNAERPPALQNLRGRLPESLFDLLGRTLDPSPRMRPTGTGVIERELDAILSRGAPIPSRPSTGAGALRLARRALRFDFTGYGRTADLFGPGIPRLHLDVGNNLGTGIVDQHHLEAYLGSSAALVRRHPEFVRETVDSLPAPPEEYTLVLHQHPDLDCLCSAYLAVCLLCDGELPEGAEALTHYADRVDAGYPGLSADNPFTLYAAHLYLSHRNGKYTWRRPEDCWRRNLEAGLELVEYVLQTAVSEGLSLWEVDAFDCPGHFGADDRKEVLKDRERYLQKLEDPACRARILRVTLPALFGDPREADALLIRGVQGLSDPDRCIFFKDWARTDRERSSGGGMTLLSVYETLSERRGRAIVSVKPDSGLTLRGLGWALDRGESAARRAREGTDTRYQAPARPGYENADPWYDGRGHTFTIVDSPRDGTALTADEVEAALLDFSAHSTRIVDQMKRRPAFGPEARASGDTLKWYSFLARQWRREIGDAPGAVIPRVLFCAAPETEAWVREHALEPLRSALSGTTAAERVRLFAPAVDLTGPTLAEMARWIEGCAAFVPVLNEAFLSSEGSLWALQNALVRDPRGEKGIVRPLMTEGTTLPRWCAGLRDVATPPPEALEPLLAVLRQGDVA